MEPELWQSYNRLTEYGDEKNLKNGITIGGEEKAGFTAQLVRGMRGFLEKSQLIRRNYLGKDEKGKGIQKKRRKIFKKNLVEILDFYVN